jgi:hypothetical protein
VVTGESADRSHVCGPAVLPAGRSPNRSTRYLATWELCEPELLGAGAEFMAYILKAAVAIECRVLNR